jgi:hypothetical protein
VTFSSATPTVVTVSGNTAFITGAGKGLIVASQPGNSNYLPALSVTNPITVAKANQSITFSPPSPVAYAKGSTFSLAAASSSGLLDFSYSTKSSKILQISGTTATIIGKGVAKVIVNQAGNTNWNKASATNTITVQ